MGLFTRKTVKTNDKDKNTKIKMVNVEQLKFDREFKAVFQQEIDKVTEIANDIRKFISARINTVDLFVSFMKFS